MDEQRIWRESAAWKEARSSGAACRTHWEMFHKPLEDADMNTRGGRGPGKQSEASREQSNETKTATYIDRWREIFAEIGGSGTTDELMAASGLSFPGTHWAAKRLHNLNVIDLIDGTGGGKPGGGRSQKEWKWVEGK
jgi:hypothetical protein